MSPIIEFIKKEQRNKLHLQKSQAYFGIALITLFASISSFCIFLFLIIDKSTSWYIPFIISFFAFTEAGILIFVGLHERKQISNEEQ